MLLAIMCIGAVFAQATPAAPAPAAAEAPKEKKNNLTLDLFPLVKGIIASDSDNKITYFSTFVGYERLVASHFSFCIDLDIIFGKWDSIDVTYFGGSVEGRYYTMSENFEKFFMGTTLGFSSLSVDGKTKPDEGGFTGMTTSLKAGYKLMAKSFTIEPSMSYVLAKTGVSSFGGSVPTPLGWQGGLRIGFTF
jgi:hypothetical protein